MRLRDQPAIKKIRWRDLVQLSFREKLVENTITLPWIFLSLGFSLVEWYALALPCSFMLFLTALRQAHNGFHYTLGINRQLTKWSLRFNGALMLTSMHAVKYNHLVHHAHCLEEEDYEGKAAHMPAWKAVLYGPLHIFHIHRNALQHGSRDLRKQVYIELVVSPFDCYRFHI